MNLPDKTSHLQTGGNDGELSLKEILIGVRDTLGFLWIYKIRILLVSVIGLVVGFGYAHFFNKVLYTSNLTFAVEEKTGSSGLSGIASQFGFDLGGGGAGLFSTDNLILLLQSDRIIQAALLTPQIDFNEGTLLNRYIGNHFEDALKEHKIEFIDPHKSIQQFTRKEDSILGLVVTDIVDNSLKVTRLEKKAGLLEVHISDVDEKWAFLMNQIIIEEAIALYLELKVGKTRRTVNLLEHRVDSVRRALGLAMSSAAQESDQNQSLIMMRARVPAAKKQLEVQMLTTLYGELVKNLELTKFTLEREEPTIEVIDSPRFPLDKKGKGRVKWAILTSFILTAGFSFFLLFRKWMSRILSDKD